LNPSQHDRSRRARLVLAAGGIGSLITAAALARYVAGVYGPLAGILVACAPFGTCGLVSGLRTFRAAGLTRPAPVRLPEPARDIPEPASSLT
jgi:hypothetical protein